MFTNALIPEEFTQRHKEHRGHKGHGYRTEGSGYAESKFFGFPL
jgi:hypothetical protein